MDQSSVFRIEMRNWRRKKSVSVVHNSVHLNWWNCALLIFLHQSIPVRDKCVNLGQAIRSLKIGYNSKFRQYERCTLSKESLSPLPLIISMIP
ncbi:hypothetical protein WICPIJ_002078 [Wickerhamomyces pijperi]|uniref:Uncharacterized protein n=1 Tax=Wickerhamomyces pijperi TaxID=599730 RepID=A0A9P8QAC9_WICPI|nr:hypothetical protein WICPIJ_002078 [Wickerhamomyces pijperi]